MCLKEKFNCCLSVFAPQTRLNALFDVKWPQTLSGDRPRVQCCIMQMLIFRPNRWVIFLDTLLLQRSVCVEAVWLAVSVATLTVYWEAFSFFFSLLLQAKESQPCLWAHMTFAVAAHMLSTFCPDHQEVASCCQSRLCLLLSRPADVWGMPAVTQWILGRSLLVKAHISAETREVSPGEAIDNFTPLLFVSKQQAASPQIKIPSEGGSAGRDTSPLPSGQSSDSMAVPGCVRMCVRICACAFADTCRKFQMPLGRWTCCLFGSR